MKIFTAILLLTSFACFSKQGKGNLPKLHLQNKFDPSTYSKPFHCRVGGLMTFEAAKDPFNGDHLKVSVNEHSEIIGYYNIRHTDIPFDHFAGFNELIEVEFEHFFTQNGLSIKNIETVDWIELNYLSNPRSQLLLKLKDENGKSLVNAIGLWTTNGAKLSVCSNI